MPRKEDDPRPNAGRCSSGKRLPEKRSTQEVDPKSAAKKAIDLYNEWEEETREAVIEIQEDKEYSLSPYWNYWFKAESKKRTSRPNFAKWSRDTQLKWNGKDYGIVHQPWAKKKVDEITTIDFENYWTVLDDRKTDDNDMSGTKAAQKSLINKLLREARRRDFPTLTIPEFPSISKRIKSVQSLGQEQWEQLKETIIELSAGKARLVRTIRDYENLPFSPANAFNVRNWVDLWDAIHLQWFFYLRSQDMPWLKHSLFRDVSKANSKDKDRLFACSLEKIKGDRQQLTTTPYRPDHYDYVRMVFRRRREGEYFLLPHLSRSGREEGKPVIRTLNQLLKEAVRQTNIKFKSHGSPLPEKLNWTTLRHTAFRLTLEEYEGLQKMDELIQFAKNGHTSVEMLQKHYLNQMNLEKATKRARAIIPEGKMQGMLTALNSKNSPIEQQAVLDEYVFKMNEEILQSKRTEAFPGEDDDDPSDEP